MRERYTYSYGFKTRERAEKALIDAFATGEVLPGEDPQIEQYRAKTAEGRTVSRYRITVGGAWI